nr:hypothetical protein Clen_227 [Cedratvirus lena]
MSSRLRVSHKPDSEWTKIYFWLKSFLKENDIMAMDFCYAVDVPFTIQTCMYFTSSSLAFPPPLDCPLRQILQEAIKGFYPFTLQTLIYRKRFANFYCLNRRILEREGVLGMRCCFNDDNVPSLEIYLKYKRADIRDLIVSLPEWPFARKFDVYYIITG